MRAGKNDEATEKDINYIHNEDQCRSQEAAAECLCPIFCQRLYLSTLPACLQCSVRGKGRKWGQKVNLNLGELLRVY